MTKRKKVTKETPWKSPATAEKLRAGARRGMKLRCLLCSGTGYIRDVKSALPAASKCPECKGEGLRMCSIRVY